MQTITTETDTMRSAMLLISAGIGLLAAIITLVNGRLNDAKTAAKKKRVLAITISASDLVIFVSGCFLSLSTTIGEFGVGLLVLSLILASSMFLFGHIENIRVAVFTLVLRFGAVVFLVMLHCLIRIHVILVKESDVIGKIIDKLR